MKLKSIIIIFSIFFSVNTFGNNIVKTSSGFSEGYLKNSVINWDDIPYAKPPIGNLRWKAPIALISTQYIKQKEKIFLRTRAVRSWWFRWPRFFFWF